MRKYSIITMFGVFGTLIVVLMFVTSTALAQQSGDSDTQLHAAHHNNQSSYAAKTPMTDTTPMGDMSQMMQMMANHMQMMGQMHGMMGSLSMTNTMPMMDSMMPMSGTMPMGDISQMMPMMMQMVMGDSMPMMDSMIPMSGTMPMGNMSQMMPAMGQTIAMTETMPMTGTAPMMRQMMGYRMQMMGLHMQMMGLHLQMMGQIHGSTSDVMPMMGMAHPQQPGMMRGATTERQAMVAEVGQAVMPFDLDATTHIFEKTEQGGIQQVVADDPDDADTIAQIRTHLAEQAERFAQGDFHNPQMIHGAAMPGLHELMMGAEQIVIEYSELPNGAQILYTTDDVDLITAIHSWFDAQVADHGPHATDHR